MNQKEYLKTLEEALNGIDPKDKEELMADFKEHFDIGLSEGQTEEAIIAHLGSVEDLIESLDLKRLESPHVYESKSDRIYNEDVEKVIIDGLHADVTINVSDDNQAHVDYEISKKLLGKLSTEVTSRQEGKTLYVTVSSINKIFKSSLDPVDLHLELPNSLKELKCKTASGDIKIDELNFETLEIHSVSGDIGLDDINADLILINGVSSDINCSSIGGQLQLRSVSGDIEVDSHTGKILSIESVSGDINYEGSAEDIRINTTSGDACLEAKSIKSLSANTISGDVRLEMDVDHKGLTVSFISNSGELRIGDEDYDTPRHNKSIIIGDGLIKLNHKSISGDFEIE
jgi:hypothetical protein